MKGKDNEQKILCIEFKGCILQFSFIRNSIFSEENTTSTTLKMISSPFCVVSVLNVCEPHTKDCESMLFVKKYVPYIRDLSNSFSNSFIDFYSCEVVS